MDPSKTRSLAFLVGNGGTLAYRGVVFQQKATENV
jgi:hypothetical protein